jgi:hypothetical protein
MKINEPNSMQMCLVLKGLMEGLKNCKTHSFNPKKIKNVLNNYELFRNGKEADVTDLLDQIFYSVISEIKNEDTSCDTIRYENRLDNKLAMFYDIKKDMDLSIIINKYFLGFYEKEYKCEKGHIKYSFQNEYRIIFPLEEISNFYKDKQKLTLDDCFSYNYQNKIKDFEKCYKCKSYFNLIEKIYQTPKILIIILDRGPNKKIRQTIEFEEYINLKDYVDDDYKGNRNEFKLVGVISHFGLNGDSGHYKSYCLCDDNNYYCFNDSYVSLITEKGKKFDISSLYDGSAYVLFYQKMKIDEKKDFLFNTKAVDNRYNSINLNQWILEKINQICNKYYFNKKENHNKNKHTWENGSQKSIVAVFERQEVYFYFKDKFYETKLNNTFNVKLDQYFNVKLEYNENYLKSALSLFEDKTRKLFFK